MTRNAIVAALIALGLAVLASQLGCRTTHLGEDTGVAYRQAVADQAAAGERSPGPALSADDAQQVMSVHRSGPKPAGSPAAAGASGSGSSTPSISTSTWPGAAGSIQLEAK